MDIRFYKLPAGEKDAPLINETMDQLEADLREGGGHKRLAAAKFLIVDRVDAGTLEAKSRIGYLFYHGFRDDAVAFHVLRELGDGSVIGGGLYKEKDVVRTQWGSDYLLRFVHRDRPKDSDEAAAALRELEDAIDALARTTSEQVTAVIDGEEQVVG